MARKPRGLRNLVQKLSPNRKINVTKEEHPKAVRIEEGISSVVQYVICESNVSHHRFRQYKHRTRRIIGGVIEIEKSANHMYNRDDT